MKPFTTRNLGILYAFLLRMLIFVNICGWRLLVLIINQIERVPVLGGIVVVVVLFLQLAKEVFNMENFFSLY